VKGSNGSVGYIWGGMATLLLFFVALKVAGLSIRNDSKEASLHSEVAQKAQSSVIAKPMQTAGLKRAELSTNVAIMEVSLNPVNK